MSDPKYLQEGFDNQLAHIIEECGEVLAAAGKTQRYGRYSYNPELPLKQRETNLVWLTRELGDLKQAIGRFEKTIKDAAKADKRNEKTPIGRIKKYRQEHDCSLHEAAEAIRQNLDRKKKQPAQQAGAQDEG